VAQGFSPAVAGFAARCLALLLQGVAVIVVAQGFSPAITIAQTPTPTERVTFDEAIRRAVEKNPSAAIAAAGILRAQALMAEARSAARVQVNGTVTTTTLNSGVEFQGSTVTPQNQLTAGIDVRIPLYAPARWARTAQADDAQQAARLNADEARRQTSLATADAYLTIIARRRVVDANVRARGVAKAHFDYAHELLERGAGSRLNELRAQQEVSLDEGLVESSRLALYRAQEALGVLLVADRPIDASDEPLFVITDDIQNLEAGPWRTDLKLFATEQQAAERVLGDSSKDRLPYLEGIFQPSTTYPSQFFLPQNSWRFLMQLSVPIFDSGQRQSQRLERQAAVDVSRATSARAVTMARSEVRAAREAIASADRGLASARAAADQAKQVVDIVNISFRAGAATNIEVIDAQGRARDADTAVGVSEDTLRRARLELLTALGRFPS
jgi:outer membrane protein TolC